MERGFTKAWLLLRAPVMGREVSLQTLHRLCWSDMFPEVENSVEMIINR